MLDVKFPMWAEYFDDYYKIVSNDEMYRRDGNRDVRLPLPKETLTDVILHGREVTESEYLKTK